MFISYKCTEYYNYLQTHLHLVQTYLQASKLHMYRRKVIKNAKFIKASIKSKMFIDLGLRKKCSLCTVVLQVFFLSYSKTFYDNNDRKYSKTSFLV